LAGSDGCDSVEVDVTTVDDFVRERNISVDLIKMDVEGSEPDVLEGMVDTLNRNPGIKIITELAPAHLERNNCSPSAFLDRLSAHGFKLYLLGDKKHERELITVDNADNIIELCRGRVYNIYCCRESR
ncbi:conserved hypothetical protein, partial [sediment metagenome]